MYVEAAKVAGSVDKETLVGVREPSGDRVRNAGGLAAWVVGGGAAVIAHEGRADDDRPRSRGQAGEADLVVVDVKGEGVAGRLEVVVEAVDVVRDLEGESVFKEVGIGRGRVA